MKRTSKLLLVIFLFSIGFNLMAQQSQHKSGKEGQRGNMPAIGQLSGTIIDSISGEPMEYTTVALYSKRNQELVNGTISKKMVNSLLKNLNQASII
jgi:hypothetical protein